MRKSRRRRKEQRSSFYKIFVVSLLTVVSLALVYIWQRVEVVRLSKKIGDLKTQLTEEKKISQYLSLEVAELSTGDWIEKIATEKLQMKYSSLNQIQLLAEYPQPQKPELTWAQKLQLVKSNLVENLTVPTSKAVERE